MVLESLLAKRSARCCWLPCETMFVCSRLESRLGTKYFPQDYLGRWSKCTVELLLQAPISNERLSFLWSYLFYYILLLFPASLVAWLFFHISTSFPAFLCKRQQFLSEAAPLPVAVISSDFVALSFLALQPPSSPEDAML